MGTFVIRNSSFKRCASVEELAIEDVQQVGGQLPFEQQESSLHEYEELL